MQAAVPHVLVVEDAKIAQRMAAHLMKSFGFTVDTADDGNQALAFFHEKQYQLVLMDLGLPDIDGLTLTETFRKYERENDIKHTPIVALSAHASEEFKRRSTEVGTDLYLCKPLTKAMAEEVLATYIQ